MVQPSSDDTPPPLSLHISPELPLSIPVRSSRGRARLFGLSVVWLGRWVEGLDHSDHMPHAYA